MLKVILLAGGKGTRMNEKIAKQYLPLCGKELICYSLDVFQSSDYVSEIILVTGEHEMDYCRKNIVQKYGYSKVHSICPGGKERYDSVYNGLMQLSDDYEGYVMIHDGARPFVTGKMIETSVKAAEDCKACTLGVPVKDTIKIVDDACFGIDTPPRKYIYQIQTPQTFEYRLLLEAYRKMYAEPTENITDDTMIVERYMDVKSKVIQGSYDNIKVTTPDDMYIAEKIIKNDN